MEDMHIRELLHRYLQGDATPAEEQQLKAALGQRDDEQLAMLLREEWEQLQEPDARFRDYDVDASWWQIVQPAGAAPRKVIWMRRMGWAAAVALLILAGAAYLQRPKTAQAPPAIAEQKEDVAPGTNKATLVLGDGSVVTLDSAGNRVISQGGTAIRQSGGQLQYDVQGAADEVTYNTLATPNGGQFKVRLPDGTLAWLNAASSIHYPTRFDDDKRVVEITGEVYLEVARLDRRQPFIVEIRTASGNRGKIEVLGTHFNINAYNDEPLIKTTLLEGSVKVTTDKGQSSVLTPGQQSQVNVNGAMNVLPQVNTATVIAWKQGYFSFAQTDLRAVMRQISRWYDVEIVYEGAVPDMKFGGAIPRDSQASEVLKILEVSGVHFRIEGKKIIVMP
ncbi:FecR domain-containing protein [Chitinophaga lutea]